MNTRPKITDVVFDFDGTCTQIPVIYEQFLEKYYEGLAGHMKDLGTPITADDWQVALKKVHVASPQRGWMLTGVASAPAAADPYILSGESANDIFARYKAVPPAPPGIYAKAYDLNPAPWREDAWYTFMKLLDHGVRLHFISNSRTDMLQRRLCYLLLGNESRVSVHGNAQKFSKQDSQLPADVINPFLDLHENYDKNVPGNLGRDVFLKRGGYFDAIFQALGTDLSRIATTVFCGDVWELDLAMPYMLGGNIHLIERAAPFNTYPYEIEIVKGYSDRGKISKDLSGVLEWL